MRALSRILLLLTLLGLPVASARGEGAVNEYPYLSRALFWRPYAYDPFTASLFHLDEEAGQAAADLELDVLDLEGGDELDALLDGDGPAGDGPGADGNSAANAVPVGRPASLRGGARLVADGYFRGALELPGGEAMLLTGDHGYLGSRTLEFWVRPEALPQERATLAAFIAPDMTPRGAPRLHPVLIDVTAAGDLRVTWRGADLPDVAAGLQPGAWRHVAVSWGNAWPYENELHILVDGKRLLTHQLAQSVGPENGLGILILGNAPGGRSGFRGRIDEIRLSKRVRGAYRLELDWPDGGLADPPRGQPYFRDAADLLLHLPFDRTTAPAFSAQPLRHDAVTITEADEDLNPARIRTMFQSGVTGDALRIGREGLAPTYAARGILDPHQGTMAFWMRPLDWDNYTRDNRFDNINPTSFGLFTVMGEYPEGSYQRVFKRAGPLMTMMVTIHMPESVDRPVELDPGHWTHVALVWRGADVSSFVDGKPRPAGGAWTTPMQLRSADDPDHRKSNPRWWLESIPESIVFDFAQYIGRARAHTLIDDVRLYRRALAPSEIANIAAMHDPRTPLAELPDADMAIRYNGVRGDVQAVVTPLMPAYAQAERVRVRVRPEAGQDALGQAEAGLGEARQARVTVQTPPLEFAAYVVEADVINDAGETLGSVSREFTREPPPWWECRAGITNAALPDWTPVRAEGNVVHVWGRDIHFGGLGLPERVISAGEDVLAGPVVLRVDGVDALQPAEGFALAGVSDVSAEGAATAEGGALALSTRATVAFDGMMWFEVTLTPKGESARVDGLHVQIPYAADNAGLVHWWSGMREFRNPRAVHIGETPPGEGVVFRSNDTNTIDRLPALRGSFIPYVMLTGMERGMAWFAENDRGWTQSTQTPAVTISRADDRVVLTLNVIAEPVEITAPRTFAFGLHPVPVKPLDPHWRGSPGYSCVFPDTFCGNNLKGRRGASSFNTYPEDDWEGVRRRIDGEGLTQGAAGLKGLRAGFLRRFRAEHGREPYPVEETVPGLYWDMQWTGRHPAHTREWVETWGLGHGDFQHYTREFVDFASWAWDEWIAKTEGFVRGAYVDDCWPAPQSLESGPVAWRIDDGHVQPGFQFRGYRERFKRMRAITRAHGLPPRLTTHTTHTFFIPYHTFFDLILDGEDHYSAPPGQADFIDKWSLPRMRFMHNGKWGLITTWLSWHGNSLDIDKWPAWTYRQQRAYAAMMALHDIMWPFGGAELDGFPLRGPDTRLVPYWDDGGLASHDHDDLKVCAWVNGARALVMLANLGDERLEARVALDPAALGLEPGALGLRDADPALLTYFDEDVTNMEVPAAADMLGDEGLRGDDGLDLTLDEQDADLPLDERRAKDPDGIFAWDAGTLTCPVRRHDYRLFLVERE